MSTLNRYGFDYDGFGEDPSGDYCEFTEAQDALAAKDAEIEALRKSGQEAARLATVFGERAEKCAEAGLAADADIARLTAERDAAITEVGKWSTQAGRLEAECAANRERLEKAWNAHEAWMKNIGGEPFPADVLDAIQPPVGDSGAALLEELRSLRAATQRKAFITGSRAYGTPTENSDIDLVVCMEVDAFKLLAANTEQSGEDIYYSQLRFGKLNIVAMEPGWFEVWKACTDRLVARKPVTREEAKAEIVRGEKEYSRNIAAEAAREGKK